MTEAMKRRDRNWSISGDGAKNTALCPAMPLAYGGDETRSNERERPLRKLQTQGVHHITLVGADRQSTISVCTGSLGAEEGGAAEQLFEERRRHTLGLGHDRIGIDEFQGEVASV